MIQSREEALHYYFYFIQERMHIFRQKRNNENPPFTDDPTLQKHKFTNVYRCLDRVSQYLIKDVIYNEKLSSRPLDILLRIIIFKVFNTISTREFLLATYGDITIDTFDADTLSALLTQKKLVETIFSAAYIMTGSHSRYARYRAKHEKWLHMVQEELIDEGKLQAVIDAHSLDEVYTIFQSCSMIGPFLAYQYAIDCNYSSVINFDENSFVVAGIGAKRGIEKCFFVSKEHSYEDYIKWIHTHFQELQQKYGYTAFMPLKNRKPTLIDLQNCFCETDKYLREKLPQLNRGNTRIKQKYRPVNSPVQYFFPPKRHISLS